MPLLFINKLGALDQLLEHEMLVVAKIGKDTRASTAGQLDSPGAGAGGPGDPPDLMSSVETETEI